ncbi:MAG TPA: molecular chaperone TorD family protein [Terriglobales bacterium]|nr:molecular chaperone TorD family protein [Terriglobales bacterium]
MRDAAIYDAFAGLLTYPEGDYPQRIAAGLRLAPAECREDLEQFFQLVRELATDQAQELFTRTFDLNPVCSLELGWHLFGENYERGLLLVRMREELRRCRLGESSELPDHLTHALRLVAQMENEGASDFVGACVLPALEKMLQAMRGKDNPFEYVLLAARNLLHNDFPELPLVSAEHEPLKVLA